MKFNPLEMYKLVEGDHFVMLVPMHAQLTLKNVELVAGDVAHVTEYLQHYVHSRVAGRRIKQAHTEALIGARVVGPNHLDAVSEEQLRIEQ